MVHPEPAPGPLDNPLKGWCPYTDANPIRLPYSMVYSLRCLEQPRARPRVALSSRNGSGQPGPFPRPAASTSSCGLFIDYPSKPSGLPRWIKDEVKLTRYEDHGGGLSPDYDNPRMVTAMEHLIAAMGKRYNNHPRVGFVQLGLLGFWGEWHTWPRVGPLRQARHRAPDHRRIPPCVSKQDTHDAVCQGLRCLAQLARLPRRHVSGRHGQWNGLVVPERPQAHRARYKLETGGDRRRDGAEPGQAMARPALRRNSASRRARALFVGWALLPGARTQTRHQNSGKAAESLVRRMGYQFRLTEVRHSAEILPGGKRHVKIAGLNEGVAPFYYPWPVELALLSDTGKLAVRVPLRCDIRTWQPGRFELESDVVANAAAGRFKLALGLIDPWTGQPAIRFANNLPTREGWTVLSTVALGSTR